MNSYTDPPDKQLYINIVLFISNRKVMRQTSKGIDKQLTEELTHTKRTQYTPKVLLLGSTDSGKTTFIKQLKLIYSHGFSQSEKVEFCGIIHLNLLHAIKVLATAINAFEMSCEKEENQVKVRKRL
jgi:guanine nucleotide-binding protein subunit alpha